MTESPHDQAWVQNWKMPIQGVSWHLMGHSMCRETTGFLIREPRIYLDSGNVAGNKTPRPAAILLTHTHFDHAGALPSLLRISHPAPTVFVPFEVTQRLRDWTRMSWAMKVDDNKTLPGCYAPKAPLEGPSKAGEIIYDPEATWIPSSPGQSFPLFAPPPPPEAAAKNKKSGSDDEDDASEDSASTSASSSTSASASTSKKPQQQQQQKQQQEMFVDIIKCHHTVTTVGYVISEKRMKLKDEYKSLPGKEIAALRKQNVDIQEVKSFPLLAYLCDTNISIFDRSDLANDSTSPEAIQHQQHMSLIFQCPVVMIECTYLEDEKRSEARKRGHIVWSDILPYTEAHPEITWVLFHFSQRYKDDHIRSFFQTASSQKSRPHNVVLWLDSGIDDPKLTSNLPTTTTTTTATTTPTKTTKGNKQKQQQQ
eukprot:TRINITY_DN7908_c2_g1_i1.p1 TRINITY_DN7908_c2_g1~~TRINITY_DN7908_c2_g1_i1.p1  ORF type:complete len:455 (-),score=116.27 TRINITY_DN7908_c2_g1_i1:238-1509(-)